MNVRKKYEFWNYRDTRKEKCQALKPFDLPSEQLSLFQNPNTVIEGKLANWIIFPLAELPCELTNKLERDLMLPNPDFIKARKYGRGFVPHSVPEYIRLYQKDNRFFGIPRSVKRSYLEKQFSLVGLKLHITDVRPVHKKVKLVRRKDANPWFYQKEALRKIVDGNVVIEFHCGQGKTFLTLLAVAEIKYRTLILVRTNVILQQWIEAITKIFDIKKEEIGIINGAQKTEGLITVATQQSLVNLSREDKRALGKRYGHVIFDECHEVAATQYRELLTFFQANRVTGLSATPEREDGLAGVIRAFIGPIEKVDDMGEIPIYVDINKTKFRFDFRSLQKETQYHKLLEALAENNERNIQIIAKVIGLVEDGHSVLVYSKRISHLEKLRAMLSIVRPQINSDILVSRTSSGKESSPENQVAVQQSFRDGKIQVLFGGTIVEQGFNVERISAVVLGMPTKSLRLLKQLIGRAQREFPGKKAAYLIDFVDEEVPVLKYQYFNRHKKFLKLHKKTSVTPAELSANDLACLKED